ncbi:MAG: glutamine-hydrolyzing GMP synthase, partial [Christensenellaceae bacterium]|nr:glutamine-hydrolyzing GMP synthase [Christensenellaceae bacterium]
MAQTQKVVILDFGGQYTQLIARRVRECKVYSEVLPYSASIEDIRAVNPVGVILSGGPASVLEDGAPRCDSGVYELGVPVLGICYGMQLTAHLLGGRVEKAAQREYGRISVTMDDRSTLLADMSETSSNWMSHTFQVAVCPAGFHGVAHSENCPVAAMANDEKRIYGVQFHPEVTHSDEGRVVIQNFLNICGCVGDWTMAAYAQTAIAQIREVVGETGTVLLGLSGGVDSSVAAALIYRAIGDRLTCVYVDHGFMRKGESEQVVDVFTNTFPVRLIRADASDLFYADLAGIEDPERKRKIIGADFIKVFKEEALKLGKLDYFAQGTIYPDVIESGQATGAAVIKSHHNVGGLPKELGFTELIEPLRMLFKDEVRALGETLGLPHDLVWRQPFPGPGLAIRVIGDLTPDKVTIVRESDAILREEIKNAGLEGDIHQYFTVLTGVRSVGVMGDERTYDYTVAIRAVTTDDFMTADWARIPYDVIRVISARIVNEVAHVNRVVLDVTTKPPASIEWE